MQDGELASRQLSNPIADKSKGTALQIFNGIMPKRAKSEVVNSPTSNFELTIGRQENA
jgi:hypothetical protein